MGDRNADDLVFETSRCFFDHRQVSSVVLSGITGHTILCSFISSIFPTIASPTLASVFRENFYDLNTDRLHFSSI